MQQDQRHVPGPIVTYCKRGVFKLWLAALVVMGMMAITQVACAFTLLFDQSAYSGDVWVQVQDATQNFAATYANGTQSLNFMDGGSRVLMSAPVKLSDIGAGGLNITFSSGAIIFVFYDDPTGNSRTAAPDFNVSTQRFVPLELTMTGGAGDQGNLTAINYFTAPLSISSYQNNPSQNPGEPVLQQTGFGSATAGQIGARFAAVTLGNPNAVVTNAQGQIIRYLGPSNAFPGTNPWPSFIPYTQSINAASQPTTILRTNSFNFYKMDKTTPDGPVYTFGTNMTATANADGSLTITGSITVTVTGAIKRGNPAPPTGGAWTNAEFDFSVSDPNAFNNAIYGQVQTSAVSFTGQAWNDFMTFTQTTLQDPSKPHDPVNNPSLYDNQVQANGLAGLNAYNTTINMFIGEVTTGLLGGFFNSDYQPGGVPPAIKNMTSSQWWSLNPIVAFSEIQPLNPYYNIYAQVIFDTTNNTVYGVPYSDRFGNGPLVNSVQYNGTDVNYWVLGVGAPLPGTKALSGMLLLQLLNN
ncbi:MAG: hypothetical protein PHU44_02965 [Syntrophales bacterium]|nr:hypothetical protein [Syntrophales bacterium]MDD5643466.1 hypothetical protein [Syntrophales bacterium]